jgi:hypothetical protein
METSVYTIAGRITRMLAFAIIIYSSIQAKLSEPESGSMSIVTGIESNSNSQLLEFHCGSNVHHQIMLNWKMSTPTSYSFQTEKSYDGNHFETTGSDGNISTDHDLFSWTDPSSVQTTTCYRLRLRDEKGNISYSRTMVVAHYTEGPVLMIGSTPELSGSAIPVELKMSEKSEVSLRITDNEGNTVLQNKLMADPGLSTHFISGVNTLQAGEYFLKVSVSGREQLSVRLIKT